jgi:hypothetical protein
MAESDESIELIFQLGGARGHSSHQPECEVHVFMLPSLRQRLTPIQEEFIANCLDMIVKTILGVSITDESQVKH